MFSKSLLIYIEQGYLVFGFFVQFCAPDPVGAVLRRTRPDAICIATGVPTRYWEGGVPHPLLGRGGPHPLLGRGGPHPLLGRGVPTRYWEGAPDLKKKTQKIETI